MYNIFLVLCKYNSNLYTTRTLWNIKVIFGHNSFIFNKHYTDNVFVMGKLEKLFMTILQSMPFCLVGWFINWFVDVDCIYPALFNVQFSFCMESLESLMHLFTHRALICVVKGLKMICLFVSTTHSFITRFDLKINLKITVVKALHRSHQQDFTLLQFGISNRAREFVK